ncbi:phage integrase N-terminal SAM-like domain-containing protein [Pseudoalteromonas sp. S3431]
MCIAITIVTNYTKSTIEAYLFWITAYIRFNNMQHALDLWEILK